MLLFSITTRRFWWPKRRSFLINKFFFFIFRKKKKTRPYFSFPKFNRIILKNRRKLFRLFSKKWLNSRFYKYKQRRLISFFALCSRMEHTVKFLEKKRVKFARLFVRFTTNNVFLTIFDTFSEKVLTHYSSGSVGFSGPTRTTLFALEQIIENACKFLNKKKINSVHLIVLSGAFNYKAKCILESLASHKMYVRALTYKLSVAHNGIRSRKSKRR